MVFRWAVRALTYVGGVTKSLSKTNNAVNSQRPCFVASAIPHPWVSEGFNKEKWCDGAGTDKTGVAAAGLHVAQEARFALLDSAGLELWIKGSCVSKVLYLASGSRPRSGTTYKSLVLVTWLQPGSQAQLAKVTNETLLRSLPIACARLPAQLENRVPLQVATLF